MSTNCFRFYWRCAFLLSAAVTFAACSSSSSTNTAGHNGGTASASSHGGTGGIGAGGTSTAGSSTGGSTIVTGGSTTSSGGVSSSGGATMSGGSTTTGGGSGGATSSGGVTTLTGLPANSSVLENMQRANTWFMTKHPDPTADIVTNKTRPSNLWTRAAYYEGLMGLYNVDPDTTNQQTYYNYAVTWGASPTHPWLLANTAAGVTSTDANNQACGQTYIDLYNIDPQPVRIQAIKASIDAMVSNGTANVWWWIDAIQMSMPVFAKLGVLYPNGGYFDAMWALYNDARMSEGGGLFNAADGLWWRDLHYTPTLDSEAGECSPDAGVASSVDGSIDASVDGSVDGNADAGLDYCSELTITASLMSSLPAQTTDAYIVAPNGKSIYWSRGNGWVFAALTRVLDILPTTDAHRATYVSDFQAIAKALVPLQRSDGFWNESLFDPTQCASIGLTGNDGPETSGTALFTYGLAWGIRKGFLDVATYGPALQSAWNGLSTIALQSDGLLGYVQATGALPCTENPQDPGRLGPTMLADFDDYGVGCFLLAGSEVYKLASSGTTSTGGTTGAGGTTSTGGTNATGGTTSTGGTSASGGATSSGGSTSTSGSNATGGATSAGGTSATGGVTSSGGSMGMGGSHATGGTTATGGTSAMGGTKATGGMTATGKT